MLAEVGEDQVVGDRGHREETRLAELALDVELLDEAEAAVRCRGRRWPPPTWPRRRAAWPCWPRRRRAGPARRARRPGSGRGRRLRSPHGHEPSGTAPPGSRRSARRRRLARRRTGPPSRRTSARRRCTRPRSGSARRSTRRGCSGSPCPPRRRALSGGTSTPSRKISVGRVVQQRPDRADSHRSGRALLAHVDEEQERPSVLRSTCSSGAVRASSSIRSEELRVDCPELVAADDVAAFGRAPPSSGCSVVSEPASASVTPNAWRRSSPRAICGR